MPKNKYDNAIFDVDGTLFDSYPSIIECVKHAYVVMHTPMPDETVLRSFVGPSLHDSFQAHTDWSEADIERAVAAYRQLYTAGAFKRVEFFPGVRKLLDDLKAAGVTLTVASSKPIEILPAVLEHKGVLHLFDKLSAPDFSHKESDKAELIRAAAVGKRPVMIGDRKFDIAGARAAGVPSIGAAYGYGGRAELQESGATYVADNTDEIYNIIIGEEL